MDPINNILSLYNTIDANSTLEIYFTYTFKFDKSIWQQIGAVLKWMWEIKKKPAE
jgi:hypothetical protein